MTASVDVWTVYRVFSDESELLYVGCTGAGSTRLMQHSAKEWWPMVKFVLTEHFTSRDEAIEAERRAILAEQPAFNGRAVGWTAAEVNQAKKRAQELLTRGCSRAES